MRDYSKVSPQFWFGETGRALRRQGKEAQLVALYLMTCPSANMLGLYYLPVFLIAHETGLDMEGASKGLAGCIATGFCRYDEETQMVWVCEMAKFQIAETLTGGDLRIKGVQNAYDSLPSNPYLAPFFARYADAFCMSRRRGFSASKPLHVKPLPKPLASQEQEQEQEQEHEQDI